VETTLHLKNEEDVSLGAIRTFGAVHRWWHFLISEVFLATGNELVYVEKHSIGESSESLGAVIEGRSEE
jgi:hypothetical protein